MKLSSLFIQSFRGATKPVTIDFDPEKSITMIFGENGNGKSTVADALVCLCREDHGTIDRPSTDKSYLCALGSTPKDVQIALDTSAGKFTATLNPRKKGDIIKSPTENIPTLRLLRRKEIIDLIDQQPSKRYEMLKEYIDVAGVTTSEIELRKLVKSTNLDLDKETKSLADSQTTLENAWQGEGKPRGSWEAWATSGSAKDITSQTKSLGELKAEIEKWKAVLNYQTSVKQKKVDQTSAETKVADWQKKVSELEQAAKNEGVKLLAVLESAYVYIKEQSKLEKCPVCKQGVEQPDLVKSLDAEISSMKELQSASNSLTAAVKENDKSKAILDSALKDLNRTAKNFCDSIIMILEFKDKKTIQELIVEADKDKTYEGIEARIEPLTDLMQRLEDEAAKIDKTLKQFHLISSNLKTIVETREKVSNLSVLKAAVEKAHRIVETTRKKFIENSLNDASADIQKLYSKMHPGEKIGDIKLFLKEVGMNSIEMTASFYTEKEVTPQSLYSESHLDTLAICIFIALAKKYKDDNTILLLDDVMMSVDESHLDRFIEMLHEESDNFSQVIITTHYRPWRDRHRNNRADGSNVHFLELRPWSLEKGISLQNGKIIIEELRELVHGSTFHREFVANTAGRALENMLDFLTFKFGSKVMRKPRNDYALRELLEALSSKLVKVMRVEHLEKEPLGKFSKTVVKKQEEVKPLIDKIKSLSAVRNQVGAHFSFEGSLVSDKDVKEFGEHVLELADLLICPELGSLPDKKPSGSYWETKSGSIRLYPLEEPK